jgi:hypothetical protein
MTLQTVVRRSPERSNGLAIGGLLVLVALRTCDVTVPTGKGEACPVMIEGLGSPGSLNMAEGTVPRLIIRATELAAMGFLLTVAA